jgi:hypothetical protein
MGFPRGFSSPNSSRATVRPTTATRLRADTSSSRTKVPTSTSMLRSSGNAAPTPKTMVSLCRFSKRIVPPPVTMGDTARSSVAWRSRAATSSIVSGRVTLPAGGPKPPRVSRFPGCTVSRLVPIDERVLSR